jgi:hypothetical protein
MGQGKAIPDCVKWIVVRLSTSMSVEDIAMYTDISQSSVQRILAIFRRTSDINIPKISVTQHHGMLDNEQIEVSSTLSLCVTLTSL